MICALLGHKWQRVPGTVFWTQGVGPNLRQLHFCRRCGVVHFDWKPSTKQQLAKQIRERSNQKETT